MFTNILNHPKTTVLGILTAVGVICGVLTTQGVTLGHAGTGSVVALISGIAAGLALLVAKDPTSSKALVFALLLLCLVFSAQATVHAQSGSLVSTSTEATAIDYAGTWSAASHQTESIDFIDWGPQKTNSLSLEAHELLMPTPGVNAYMGGVKIVPDISAIMSKTNVSADLFGVYAQGAVGVATTAAGSKISYQVGGGAEYRLTSNLAWTAVHASFGQVGSTSFTEISTGLDYIFNPTAAKSMAAKRFLLARAIRK